MFSEISDSTAITFQNTINGIPELGSIWKAVRAGRETLAWGGLLWSFHNASKEGHLARCMDGGRVWAVSVN
jgi:hypothetical protein